MRKNQFVINTIFFKKNNFLTFLILLLSLVFVNNAQAQVENYNEYIASYDYNPDIENLEDVGIVDVPSKNDQLNNSIYNYAKTFGKNVPISGNISELYKFFRALKQSRSKKIRVAHYGDSILLGDVITEGLRENFQRRFGGDGVGMLSITPDDIRMKRSITQTISGRWLKGSITKGNPKHFPIGITGVSAKATSNSKVKFVSTNFMKNSRSFKIVRILYSNAKSSSSIQYSFENNRMKTIKLKSGPGIKEILIKSSQKERRVDINFGNAAGTYFYGVSLENGNGVYVDNFALTGNSGVSLTKIKKQTLKEFNKYLGYKLIIINFGVNATQLTMNYKWYKNKMIRVIKHFKSAIPDASILVVSIGDKGIKRGSRFISDPKVLRLLKTQKEIVARTNVAFWNLYEAMGGKNSINNWVNAGPPLSLRDYIHFTSEGGRIVSNLLTKALMKEYNNMR